MPNLFLKSWYFWLLKAFIGEVYITLFECLAPRAIPYSATTVFPLDVCAHTKTFLPSSKRIILRFWNVSNSKGKLIALFSIRSYLDTSIVSSSA